MKVSHVLGVLLCAFACALCCEEVQLPEEIMELIIKKLLMLPGTDPLHNLLLVNKFFHHTVHRLIESEEDVDIAAAAEKFRITCDLLKAPSEDRLSGLIIVPYHKIPRLSDGKQQELLSLFKKRFHLPHYFLTHGSVLIGLSCLYFIVEYYSSGSFWDGSVLHTVIFILFMTFIFFYAGISTNFEKMCSTKNASEAIELLRTSNFDLAKTGNDFMGILLSSSIIIASTQAWLASTCTSGKVACILDEESLEKFQLIYSGQGVKHDDMTKARDNFTFVLVAYSILQASFWLYLLSLKSFNRILNNPWIMLILCSLLFAELPCS